MNSRRQVVIFLVFVIGCILLLSLVFSGGSSNDSSKPTAQKQSFSLLNYVNRDSKVVAITDGRINGDDQHRAIRITVSPTIRQIDIVQGYEGKVIDTKQYPNNQKAYSEFMNALSRTGFGKVRKGNFKSEDGVCASGKRYVYELIDGTESVSRTWTANCVKGNSPAAPSLVSNLFQRQITDYNKIIDDVEL